MDGDRHFELAAADQLVMAAGTYRHRGEKEASYED
jgi:hypothetical protein